MQSYTGPHGYEVRDVAISKDNARFASCGGDKVFFLWDVATARVVRKFTGHAQMINAVAFNEEGSVVLSASYDRTGTYPLFCFVSTSFFFGMRSKRGW